MLPEPAVCPVTLPVTVPMVQLNVAPDGVLVSAMFVVPPLQIAVGETGFAVGAELTVTTTSSVDAVQGEFEIVHRTVTGPVPPVWVNVAFGVVAFGLNVPVPPPTTLQLPVPLDGVFPPKPAVVPLAQIVCAPPTVAVVGGWLTVTVALPLPVMGQLPLSVPDWTE